MKANHSHHSRNTNYNPNRGHHPHHNPNIDISLRPDGNIAIHHKRNDAEHGDYWETVRVVAVPSVEYMLDLTTWAKENGGW